MIKPGAAVILRDPDVLPSVKGGKRKGIVTAVNSCGGKNVIRVHRFGIVETESWHISFWEEITPPPRDEKGRFKIKEKRDG